MGVLARNASILVAYGASQIGLATGGGGQIYRETTNPTIATSTAWPGTSAGAAARDLEFVQFHLTCLYIAALRVLISEIVRGAGGSCATRTASPRRRLPQGGPGAP